MKKWKNKIVILLSIVFLLLGTSMFFHPKNSLAVGEFITTWQTDNSGSSNPDQITIPLYPGETYNFDVDWGDGNTDTGIVSDSDITHTYAVAGTYTVSISGVFPRIYFNGNGDASKIISIDQWGNIAWTSMNNAFSGTDNLVINAIDTPNLSGVTDMHAMFEYSSMNQDISSWNVSNVTDISNMFHSDSSFNQPLNSWNVSNVTDMSGMFNNDHSFNQPLNSWVVSSVTNMSDIFNGDTSFNQDISSWNVSNVTDMSGMFNNDHSFNQPLNSWVVSSVTNMSDMFNGASAFNQPLSSWNVSNVTDMSYMFNDDASFNQPLNSWNVSNVTNMRSMFSGASSFNQPLDTWNTANVTDMRLMFNSAFSFNQPLNSWNVSNVTNIGGMFTNDSSFNQPLNTWNTSNVHSMAYTFNDTFLFDQDISSWDVSNVTDMSYMFNGDTSFNQNISSWDVSNVTDTSYMFDGASAFNKPLDTWNVSNVTYMRGMFSGATSFNQNISSWNVSNVTDMFELFNDAIVFNQPLDSWNVMNVTNMGSMFHDANSFNKDISSWNVSNVTDMSFMFGGNNIFNQDISSWNVSNVTNMSGMFQNDTLAVANYDALLVGWSTESLQINVTFDAGNSKYCHSDIQRNNIITNYGWIINDIGVNCNHSLNYTAGAHGSISGSTSQSVLDGTDGTAVNAVPQSGYQFSGWSDSSTQNPRIDTNVIGDISVTANFVIPPPPPQPSQNHGCACVSTDKKPVDPVDPIKPIKPVDPVNPVVPIKIIKTKPTVPAIKVINNPPVLASSQILNTFQVKPSLAKSNQFRNLLNTFTGKLIVFILAATTLVSTMTSVPMATWRSMLSFLAVRKRKPWGTVYDSITKQPLDPAYVVLQDMQGNEVNVCITDLDGRYGFFLNPGQYKIVANKTNYVFPSVTLVGKEKDVLYSDLYFGEPIDISTSGEIITKNIPMDPLNFDWNEYAKREQKLLKYYSKRDVILNKISNIFFYLGFTLSSVAILNEITTLNITIFALYILIFFFRTKLIKPKPKGTITDQNGNPIPFAIIKVYSATSNTEITHKIANALGNYYCLTYNGTYYVTIEKKNDDGTYTLIHKSEPFEVTNGVVEKDFKI